MVDSKGIDDALKNGNEIKPIKGDELKQLMKLIEERLPGNQVKNDFNNVEEEEFSHAQLAESYLVRNGHHNDGHSPLRYYKDEFYIYKTSCYERIKKYELTSLITKWLQGNPATKIMAKIQFVKEMILNIKGKTYIDSSKVIPFWLNNEKKEDENDVYVCMKNGLINMTKLLEGSNEKVLQKHNSNYFTLYSLPYDWKPKAKCEIFMRYLKEVQPNSRVRDFLQEWLGYNLIYNTKFEKFVFFIGVGANGKSVFLTIMRSILGIKNISAISLEAFVPGNRFSLASTHGKLANMVGDLNEIKKVAEGMLKQYVTGEVMTVEKKHKDHFEMIPTARLTYSMNNLPSLHDRSNGLWRRLVVVNWKIVIPKEKRNKDYLETRFWQDSNELSGIFNWAINGLKRLLEQQHFTICNEIENNIEKYRRESNPTRMFLEDCLIEREGVRVHSSRLYSDYSNHMKNNDLKPLGTVQFGKEVRKVYPNISQSENPVRSPWGRNREWINISFKE